MLCLRFLGRNFDKTFNAQGLFVALKSGTFFDKVGLLRSKGRIKWWKRRIPSIEDNSEISALEPRIFKHSFFATELFEIIFKQADFFF